jgi:hypothetical protein
MDRVSEQHDLVIAQQCSVEYSMVDEFWASGRA